MVMAEAPMAVAARVTSVGNLTIKDGKSLLNGRRCAAEQNVIVYLQRALSFIECAMAKN